jgi:thymidylate kinase
MSYLITFCGVDGAGKSTLLNMLTEQERFKNALFIRKNNSQNVEMVKKYHQRVYDGNRDWIEGAFSRSVSMAGAFDFLNHYEEKVLPAIHLPALTICDRYAYCFWAYMLMTGHREEVGEMFSKIAPANLIVYVEANPDLLEQRYNQRGGASEDESKELMTLYHHAYKELFACLPIQVITINNSGSIDDSFSSLERELTNWLNTASAKND